MTQLTIPPTARLIHNSIVYKLGRCDEKPISWIEEANPERTTSFSHEEMLSTLESLGTCLEKHFYSPSKAPNNNLLSDLDDEALCQVLWKES